MTPRLRSTRSISSAKLEHKPLDRYLLARFAEEVRGRGDVVDLGCGPGHVARYLSELGVAMVGVDLSEKMVAVAARLNPSLHFHVGDMMELDYPDDSFSGAVSFYSIVHFGPEELLPVFREMRRVVGNGGVVLLAFHVGDEVVHAAELFGAKVSLNFRFHRPETILNALNAAGFAPFEESEREPYAGVEYQSRRCYILARATKP
jgi:SAM-dependent methyltransferase